ncbi:hypothetical protein GO755_13820 [Spirosoma sp. HMF4905]|uniref:DUF1080 domain-containing protein n=1 Tax=Spirosoma arboris TaxID=2682092 RepID=A0A7K1SBB3_9BACT|nr:hypothetical protein [Spirosoma arboris]MVM31114.1 hypothetical protein [Spirosoma arboris]
MRLFLTTCFIALASVISLAQSTGRRAKSAIYSASSDWQKVTLKATARLTTTSKTAVVSPSVTQLSDRMEATSAGPSSSANIDFRPAFVGDFATNRNGWRSGNRGDYNYQIGMGRYSVRKLNVRTQQVAFSAVELPVDINLNKADIFTIKVDVLADSGQVPTGGILFGVKDSLNYNAFMLNVKGEVSIIRVANGRTFSDYMSGDYFSPGVSVEKNRNRLMIQRKGDTIRFYINNQEIRTSPYQFKILSGNGIGIMASGYWTSFQKLSVTLGL